MIYRLLHLLGFTVATALLGALLPGKALAEIEETLPEDYLSGRINAEGMQAIFSPVDETRESIVKKQQALHSLLKKHPKF